MPNPPSAVLDAAVAAAAARNAADIIFAFDEPPALKADGALVRLEMPKLSDTDLHTVVGAIVPQAKLAGLEKERQADFAYASADGKRFRVNVFFQRGHMSVVMRYVRDTIRSADELGLPELVKDLVENDNGLILMVGPTGSGKSTTLAAMVDHVNATADKHIITIEDPVEYVYRSKRSLIAQRELGVDALSFAGALRAALREAPDVILLGEMRDLESISTAITVAETGHLVLSTIHANSAPGTIDRIIDIFPAEQKEQIRIQLADILLAVLNQRLVPRADGTGSALVLEIMMGTPAVKNAIRTGNSAQLPNVIQTGAGDGMVLLDDALLKLVRRGEITKETALAYSNDRATMQQSLHGA